MPMKLPLYQVDAFADRLFSGNPAAVIITGIGLPEARMQAIAAENNLSESAFVLADGEGYAIRWFTPTVEVDLCGHATLASAHVLYHHLGWSGGRICFASKSGPLYVRKESEILYLDFPADPPRDAEPPQALLGGLRAVPKAVYKGRDDFMALFENEDAIRSLRPDMGLLAEVPARGIIVTAPGQETDFVSRFFAPRSGIPEDPVTGSAHTTLTPYWSRRLGKKRLQARQLSMRGGDLLCNDLGPRIEIGGKAVTYFVGEISL